MSSFTRLLATLALSFDIDVTSYNHNIIHFNSCVKKVKFNVDNEYRVMYYKEGQLIGLNQKGGETVSFNYNKLKGRIIEKYGTMGAFADELNISKQILSQRMTNRTRLSQEEIVKWAKMLGIPQEEYGLFFLDES